MEVKKVLVSAFLLTTCLMSGQAQRRNEIQVPDLDGYTTLKCDFHMHLCVLRWSGLAYRACR